MAPAPSPGVQGWSGARPPPLPGGWFDGRGFFLNEVLGEELHQDDPRLTEEERLQLQDLQDAAEAASQMEEQEPVLMTDVGSPRCRVPKSANNCALDFAGLNHDPAGLRAALLTTFDLMDVDWFVKELRLPAGLPLTLCMHPWPNLPRVREKMLTDLRQYFDDAVVHFPGGVDNSGATVHSKLTLLEFGDRLRVALSSANLKEKHWGYTGEVVWVQDFRRRTRPMSDDGQPLDADVAALLHAGGFARTLAHAVCELLQGAEDGRQADWARRLSDFDFSDAAGPLVISCPGLYGFAPRPAPGCLALHLRAELAPAEGGLPDLPREGRLERAADGTWEVHRPAEAAAADGGGLDGAAGGLEGRRPWWPLLLFRQWARWRHGPRPLARLRLQSGAALDALGELGLAAPQVVRLEPPEAAAPLAPTGVEQRGQPLLGEVQLRAEVRDCGEVSGWGPGVPALLAHLEVNYGLWSLKEHLSPGLWMQREEQCYVAITGSLSVDEPFLDELDMAVGRNVKDGVGPVVVAPGGDRPVNQSHLDLQARTRLAVHAPPAHAPGREEVRNHAKLITRQFLSAGSSTPYGWVYVGSHNLTKSAWGSPCEDRLWISNRELGVLLLEPREGHDGRAEGVDAPKDHLFNRAPLPFGFPLLPADVSGRERESEMWAADPEVPTEEEPAGEWDSWGNWGSWHENEWWDEWDESWDGGAEHPSGDWRLSMRAWWWWA